VDNTLRYWWVNHKQTVTHEIAGSYLWSPKAQSNGARSQFYDNMRMASLGDLVVSYANAKIKYIGIVSDYVISAPKPDEFGHIGYWSTDGWLLPVTWYPVQEVKPKDLFDIIKPLLPAKYSPISLETGHGNQAAYLAEISKELFEVISTAAGLNSEFILPAISFRTELLEDIESSEENAIVNSSLSDTEKKQIIKARKGQGDFRNSLFNVEPRCRLTGIENPSLLIASHIKPWRSCISSIERLDCFNGLLLAPHVDYLFDRGFISFFDDGNLMISDRLTHDDRNRLGVTDTTFINTPLKEEQKSYMNYHRENIFLI
jgi:putative restriction endonuclease